MIVVDLPLTYHKRNLKEKIYRLLLLIPKSELFSKGSTALVFKVGGMLSIYFFHFLLAKFAGAEANGIFSTFFTLLSIIAVVSILGLDTFLLKELAYFNSKQQWGCLRNTYKKAISIVLTISISLSILLYILFTNGCLDFYKQSDIVYYLIFAIIPFSVLHINAEAFRAIKNIKLFSFFKNFSIFGLAAILLIIANGSELNIGVSAFTISVISLSVLSIFLWFRIANKLHAPIGENVSVLVIMKESFPMFLSGSLFLLMSWVDILMLGHFNSQTDVGVYTIALKLAALCTLILFAANTILGPKISELYYNNQMQRLTKTVQNTAKYTFLLSLPIFGVILFFPDLLLALFGSEFNNKLAIETLIILSIGQMTNVFFGTVIYILDMTGKQNVSKNILLFTAFVNIAFNWYLIPIYGIKGAAIATAISIFCWTILGAIYVKKHLNFYAFPIFKN
mgnify:FL=1